jgi:hypothetical protein
MEWLLKIDSNLKTTGKASKGFGVSWRSVSLAASDQRNLVTLPKFRIDSFSSIKL